MTVALENFLTVKLNQGLLLLDSARGSGDIFFKLAELPFNTRYVSSNDRLAITG